MATEQAVLSRQRRWQLKQMALGRCCQCGARAHPGCVLCGKCAKRNRDKARLRGGYGAQNESGRGRPIKHKLICLLALLIPLRLHAQEALPAKVTVTTNRVQIRFVTPGAGSYAVVTSADCLHWQYWAPNHETRAVHVTVNVPKTEPVCFYRVEFRKEKGDN